MISSTNESIKNSVAKHKREQKALKVDAAKNEISQDGLMDDIPAMITLQNLKKKKWKLSLSKMKQ